MINNKFFDDKTIKVFNKKINITFFDKLRIYYMFIGFCLFGSIYNFFLISYFNLIIGFVLLIVGYYHLLEANEYYNVFVSNYYLRIKIYK